MRTAHVDAQRVVTAGDDAHQRAEWCSRAAEYDRKWNAFERRRAEVLPLNKAALFTALAEAGVHVVAVAFDGSGDSGQTEAAAAFDAEDQAVEIPAVKVSIRSVEFETAEVTIALVELSEAIETMAYELLVQTHDSWEDSDGGHGDFTFTVADQSIQLDFNERLTGYTNYQHAF